MNYVFTIGIYLQYLDSRPEFMPKNYSLSLSETEILNFKTCK